MIRGARRTFASRSIFTRPLGTGLTRATRHRKNLQQVTFGFGEFVATCLMIRVPGLRFEIAYPKGAGIALWPRSADELHWPPEIRIDGGTGSVRCREYHPVRGPRPYLPSRNGSRGLTRSLRSWATLVPFKQAALWLVELPACHATDILANYFGISSAQMPSPGRRYT